MNRRGNLNRPYFDDLDGRSRGSQHHYPQREQQHHHTTQQSNYWQDEFQSNNESRYNNQQPWTPANQGYNQAWTGYNNQSYWNNSSPNFQPQHRPLGPPPTPQSNREYRPPKRCFGSSFQTSWEHPSPPPPLFLPPHRPVAPPVAVNPPPGSKEAREKRLEESRERLMKSLKESKSEPSCAKETPILEKGTARCESSSKTRNVSPVRVKTTLSLNNTSQQRRLSLESNSAVSMALDNCKKPTLAASKRIRSTSCSSSSAKKSDNPSLGKSKGHEDSQIQDIKQQVIQQLLTLSQNKLHEIVSNPRSRKFEFVMKYMMKESRCEQAQKQRQLAQAGIVGTPAENTSCDLAPLDYETLLSDPDLAVNLSNLPPEMIATLGNIFNLKSEVNDSIDLDSDDLMIVNEFDSEDALDPDINSVVQEALERSHFSQSGEMSDDSKDVLDPNYNPTCSIEENLEPSTTDNMMLGDNTSLQVQSANIPSESDSPATKNDVLLTSPTMDFPLPMNLEDVNPESSLPSSANGSCSDTEDISSVFTAMEHSAESLTDSLEQIQFQIMPSEDNSVMLPAAMTLPISEENEDKNVPCHLLPVQENLSSLPVYESVEETPTCPEAHAVDEPLIVETVDEDTLPINTDISSDQSLMKSSSDQPLTSLSPDPGTDINATSDPVTDINAISDQPLTSSSPDPDTDINAISDPDTDINAISDPVTDINAISDQPLTSSVSDSVTDINTISDQLLMSSSPDPDIESLKDSALAELPAVSDDMTTLDSTLTSLAEDSSLKTTESESQVEFDKLSDPVIETQCQTIDSEPRVVVDEGSPCQVSCGADIESGQTHRSQPMVMIEQSLLDHVNISINENFENRGISQVGNNSYETPSPSNRELPIFETRSLDGIVKMELEDNSDTVSAVFDPLELPRNIPVEVSTQTDIPSRSASKSHLDAMLNEIENLCRGQGLQPAFQHLKQLLNARDTTVDVSKSTKRSRQTVQSPQARTLLSVSDNILTTSALPRETAPSPETDSLQTILSEIAAKVLPQDKLKLLFKKITEIENKIESWVEMKKKLYEQVNGILRDEQSASSSQEDNDDAPPRLSTRRTQPEPSKKIFPAVKDVAIKVDRVRSVPKSTNSVSKTTGKMDTSVVLAVLDRFTRTVTPIDDCEVPPNIQSKKRPRRKGSFGAKRKKKRSSPSKSKALLTTNVAHKFTAPRPSPPVVERTRTLPLKSSECVIPRSNTPYRAPVETPPLASSRRSRRVDAVINPAPTIGPLRKTKAELKQMVLDPIESDPSPTLRKTRTSRTTSDSLSPEELPQSEGRSDPSPTLRKTRTLRTTSDSHSPEELPQSEGRRITRHQSVSEPIEEKVTPQAKKRPRPSTGDDMPRTETSRRSKRRAEDGESECQVVYTTMTMKNCSVVIEPLRQTPVKKPRLSVKTDLFDTAGVLETESLQSHGTNDDDESSSDDDVPLLKLSKPKVESVDIPVLPAIDMWSREDAESSCDTGTTIDPRTDDGEATPATSSHKSKKKKSKKSKSRGEDGEQSEHHSSKHNPLTFVDHQRGTILEIKVCNRQVLAASEDGVIFSYSFKSGKLKKQYSGHTAAITCFCLIDSELGDEPERLVTGSLDEYSRSFILKSGEESHPPLKVGAAVSIDQKWGSVYIGTKLGEVVRIDTKTFTVVDEHMKFSQEAILALKATKEGPRKVLIVGTRNQAITVRDAETGLLLRSVSGTGQHTVYSLLLHKALVYCGTMQGIIPVFDFTNGKETCRFMAGNGVRCIKIYYGLLFAGCYDGFIYVFNVNDQRLIKKIQGSGKMILCMDIAKNKIIFSCKDSFQVLNFPPDVCQALKEARSK